MIVRRCVRATGAGALLLVSVSLPAMASAQLAGEIAPPERAVVDENGVNVATGTYRMVRSDFVVGSGLGALEDVRAYGRQAYRDAKILVDDRYTTSSVAVGVGDKTYRFDRSGGGFVAASDGARLDRLDGVYRVTLPDGTRYTYGQIEKASRHSNSMVTLYDVYAYLTSIEYPSGFRTDFTWLSDSYCPFGGTNDVDAGVECRKDPASSISGAPPQIWLTRLASVSNSAGYRLDYTYAGNDLGGYTRRATPAQISAWQRLTNTQGGNVHGGSGPLPSASYVYATTPISGGYVSTDDVTDALGRTTRYTKQVGGSGSYEAVRRPGSPTDNIRYNIDASFRVTSVVRDGATWTYAFSAPGAPSALTVTDPTGRTRKYQSDLAVGLPTRIEDEYGRVTQYSYENNRLKTATSPGLQVTTYSYDANANVTSTVVTAPDGATLTSSASYADLGCATVGICNRMTSSTDTRGVTTSYAYDPTHGGLTSVVIANAAGTNPSVQTRYVQVNGVWFPNRTWSCRTQASCDGTADAVQSTTSYNANLLPTTTTSGAGDASLLAATATTYSAAGDALTVDGPLPGAADTVRFYYDAARQPLGVIGVDPDGGGARLRQATRRAYDPWGRVTSVVEGTAGDQGDAALANMTVVQTQTMTLDAAGRTTSVALSAGGTTFARTDFAYDRAGRPTCTAQRMNPASLGSAAPACTLGTAGAFGSDRVSMRRYGPAGALSGAWTSLTSGYGTTDVATETVRQTITGKVASVTNGNARVTTYGYDALDRPTRTTFPGGSFEEVVYAPAASGSVRTGDVSSVRLRDGKTVSFGYDALGRRATTTFNNPVDVTDSNLTYTYDLLGQVTLAQDGNGHNVGYTRDALGRVTAESGIFGGTLTSQYDAAGRRTRMTWGDGFFVTYEYDLSGAMTAVRENGGGLVLASYAYDDLGRRVSRTLGNGTNTTYGYDAASQLTALNLNGGGQPSASTFTYNPAGQIASRTVSNDAYGWAGAVNANRAYTVNVLDQYTASGTVVPTYDGRGNLTRAGGAAYLYNSKNQLSGANGTYLYYDAAGRLDQVTQSSLGWQWDGDRLVTEWSGGALVRRYVHGAGVDEPIVWYDGAGTGQRRWLDADERGSIVRVTDDAGGVVAVNTYDEYGIPGSGNAGRFQYTGQMWMPELGFYHYKARMYSPTLGRFLQPDPIGYGDGLNLYGYVGGDPVNMRDPSGLNACPKGMVPVPLAVSQGSVLNGSRDGLRGFRCEMPEPDIVVEGKRQPSTWDLDLLAKMSFGPPSISGGTITGGSPQSDDIVVTGVRLSKDRTLVNAAENAANSIPPFFNSVLGRTAFGWLRGILIHSRFAANIRAMNNPMYSAEVSYLRGKVVPYGTPGATRVDAVVGNPASPLFAIDLKTGAAVLAGGQLSDYRGNIPPSALIQQILIP